MGRCRALTEAVRAPRLPPCLPMGLVTVIGIGVAETGEEPLGNMIG